MARRAVETKHARSWAPASPHIQLFELMRDMVVDGRRASSETAFRHLSVVSWTVHPSSGTKFSGMCLGQTSEAQVLESGESVTGPGFPQGDLYILFYFFKYISITFLIV